MNIDNALTSVIEKYEVESEMRCHHSDIISGVLDSLFDFSNMSIVIEVE